MKKIFIAIGSLVLLVFLVGEGIGRYFGLCTYPLYSASEQYEYIHAPNQAVRIYGNRFATNSYSMRSLPIDTEQDTTVVLLIGDSVINGGNRTDQDSLASTKLEILLSAKMGQPVRVLNISAGSWGPDNGAAYLNEHGMFGADMMVMVYSSHDAFDNMTFKPVVGIHPQYPSKQAPLAWMKIIERGMQQFQPAKKGKQAQKQRQQNLGISEGKVFNQGLADLVAMGESAGIPVVLYLHATTKEIKKKKSETGREEIKEFAALRNLKLMDELDLGVKPKHFIDDIHFNDLGQQFLADQLAPVIEAGLLEPPVKDIPLAVE
ncbi:hypothetical protein [Pontibacter sp. G13]|uniref:hypothetical protein n=1 Tax=Pontibacter sp. G13 TaxID=3074898 RepID=UPI00288A29BA|nr:hypothetical protein [Pontibacter sp. G13]WNJ16409.1 hypothetical protein RJD25_16210 [Pontibacter sp. G13]